MNFGRKHLTLITYMYLFIVFILQINWPATAVASRKYHVSCSRRSAEISAILEERILGSAPKVKQPCQGIVLL